MTNFLSLPAEIRNRIYHLAIPKGETYEVTYTNNGALRKIAPPCICRTTSQIRAESLPIWRSCNTFLLNGNPGDAITTLRRFLRAHQFDAMEHIHLFIKFAIKPRYCQCYDEYVDGSCFLGVHFELEDGVYAVTEWNERQCDVDLDALGWPEGLTEVEWQFQGIMKGWVADIEKVSGVKLTRGDWLFGTAG